MTDARRWAVRGYALVLTLAVTGPALRPGYLLLRDAVSTPRSYPTDTALGLGGTAPRAVPQDFAVAALSALIDGGMVVKSVLIAAVFLAALGAARLAGRLVADSGTAGEFIAATLAAWNPFVAERLLQGHWSLLLGYGCLPWVAAAAVRTDWVRLVFWTALAGITPTGLILAAVVALVCAPRRAAIIAALATAAASPWLLASVLGDALGSAQASGLAPFAARAEPGLGTLGSLAGLGGIWNAEAVPPSRTTLFALPATLVLVGVVALGIGVVLHRPTARALLALAVAGVVLPAAMATGPGLAVLRTVVDAVPGLAVLRDAQKWVALAMPGYALCGAGSVLTVRRFIRPALWAPVCCVALIAVLGDLAWGVGGRMTPVRYPPQWAEVAAAVNAGPRTVAVLPADSMRLFTWAGPAPVLDPLPRWVRAEVLSTGDVTVAGRTVTGEGDHARAVQRLLLSGADPATLAAAGVGWVVVEGGTPGDMGQAARTLARLPIAYRDGEMTLYRAGGMTPPAAPSRRIAVIAAHLLWAGMLIGSAAVLAVQSARRPWRRS